MKSTYKVQAITYHHLRGEGLTGKKTKTPYDLENIKSIIFDEIMLFTHSQLCKIQAFMEEHPCIEFLATGDPNQLEAINDILKTERKIKYVRVMFPHLVVLKTNKRLEDKSDRSRLKAVQDDIEKKKLTVQEIVEKHFSKKHH